MKPQPTHELIVELSGQCERCLTLYAISESARAFLKAECAGFGLLKPVDLNPDQPPQVLRLIIGQPAEPRTPAPESVVFSLHVWPNFDLQQVRAWLEAWPHVGEPFEKAINAIKEMH